MVKNNSQTVEPVADEVLPVADAQTVDEVEPVDVAPVEPVADEVLPVEPVDVAPVDEVEPVADAQIVDVAPVEPVADVASALAALAALPTLTDAQRALAVAALAALAVDEESSKPVEPVVHTLQSDSVREANRALAVASAEEAKRLADEEASKLIALADKMREDARIAVRDAQTKPEHDAYLLRLAPVESDWQDAVAEYDLLFEKYCADAYAEVLRTKEVMDEVLATNPRSKPVEPVADATSASGKTGASGASGSTGASGSAKNEDVYTSTDMLFDFVLSAGRYKTLADAGMKNGKSTYQLVRTSTGASGTTYTVRTMVHSSKPKNMPYYARLKMSDIFGKTDAQTISFSLAPVEPVA